MRTREAEAALAEAVAAQAAAPSPEEEEATPGSPPAIAQQASTVSALAAKRASSERDAALAAQARLTHELEQSEGRALQSEKRAAALQAEVDGLTAQLQTVILSHKKTAEQSSPFLSPFSRKR